jgi:hypothetical protein
VVEIEEHWLFAIVGVRMIFQDLRPIDRRSGSYKF